MADVTTIRPGRWGLSRIIDDGPRAFTVAAMRDRIAPQVEAYYPPLSLDKTAYTLPVALVRFPQGVTLAPGLETRLFGNMALSATLGTLSLAQRSALRGIPSLIRRRACSGWPIAWGKSSSRG